MGGGSGVFCVLPHETAIIRDNIAREIFEIFMTGVRKYVKNYKIIQKSNLSKILPTSNLVQFGSRGFPDPLMWGKSVGLLKLFFR